MLRKLFVMLLALVAYNVLTAAPVKERKAQTIEGWGTVIDPDRDCKVMEDGGRVTITVPTTRHDLSLFNGKQQHNAPRILQDVKGNLLAGVKVRTFPPAQANTASGGKISYHSAGMLLWLDDNNYVRLERGSCGETAQLFIEAEHWQDNKLVSWKSIPLLVDRDTWLRMIRADGKLALSFSDDGDTWTEALAPEMKLPEKLKIGVLAINTTTTEFAPILEEFKVEKK